MKKHLIAALLVIVMCLAALSGCSVLKVLEKDLQLVLKVEDKVYAVYDISIYNNAVITAPEAPEGKSFYGWTPQSNWEELEQSEVIVTPKATFVAYNDVKEFVEYDASSVTLYAAFYEIPPKDLVVAWYRAEGVSTATGLTQEIMDTFTSDMYAFLETKDYTPADMDIVIRPYDGNVGTSCGNILSDGDVDIMVAWGTNIKSTGGITAVEDVSGVQVGTISRNLARLNDKYLTKLVFVWILNTYGGQNLEYPDPNAHIHDYKYTDNGDGTHTGTCVSTSGVCDALTIPDVAHDFANGVCVCGAEKAATTAKRDVYVADTVLNVSVWNKNWEWITEAQLEKLKTDFAAYIESRVINYNEVTVNWIVEKATGVADLGQSVLDAGNIDIVIGCGTNVNTTGKLTNVEKLSIAKSDYMTDGRFIAVVNKYNPGQLAILLYTFMADTDYPYTACTHSYPATYEKSDTQHWQVCDICNRETAKAGHEYSDGVCVCGATEPVVCEHSYPETYEKDDTQHWQICSLCNEPSEKANHEYGENDVCVCGAVKPAEPDPVTLEDTALVVSIWKNGVKWVSDENIAAIKKDFDDYLKEYVTNYSDITITWIEETATKVAALGESVNKRGDVDFVMGAGGNIDAADGAGLSNLEKLQVAQCDYMTANRYIAVLHKDNPNQIAVLLYEFISGSTYPSAA